MSVAQDAARRYIEEGSAVVPIPFKAKGPNIKGWQKLRITLDEVPKYFNGCEQNIGKILGEASNGLTDIDLDCGEARALARYFLPPTASVFGRTSAPRSHWEYVVNPAIPSQQWADTTKKGKLMLVELRGTGVQTVFPPSVHPSGEPIEFDEDGKPAVVEAAVLRRAVSRLAAASLLVRYWPDGSRHDCVLALAGGLLRGGWTEVETTDFIEAIVTVTESETIEKHLAAVHDTAEKVATGETNITGWPTLSELLTARVVKTVREWCGCEAVGGEVTADVVRELNGKHAVVMVGGRCDVLTEVEDARRKYKTITLSRPGDFTMFYKNRVVQVGKQRMDLGTYWLGHSARRQYKSVVFAPEGCEPDEYNLWRGFAEEPKEGDCSLYLAHLRDNIVCGNTAHFQYVLTWMANIVQHPGNRPGTSLVVRGNEGTGKGVMAKGFGRLFGQHFVHLTQSRHLVGNFNAHLREALVVFVDEAFWAGDKSAEGVLKALITEERHMVEAKGFDPIQVDNYTHYIISSNNEWIVPAGATARRFAAFTVSDQHMQDIEYFKKIETQMENGGSAALLHYLLHYDGSGIDLRRVPQTAALVDQKDLSMTPVQRFWKNCLMKGSNTDVWSEKWDLSVECAGLHKLYCEEAGKLGLRHRANETELGMQLKKLVPSLRKRREWYTISYGRHEQKRRHYVWDFPDLDTCRRAFENVMNCKYDWTVEEDPTIPT